MSLSVQHHFDRLAPQQEASYGEARGRSWLAWLARRDARALQELLGPAPQGATLLDVGCGAGLQARAFRAAGFVVCAVDLSPHMLALAQAHADEVLLADMRDLSLGRTFDRVTCLGVLDFVTEEERCFANLARHVRPGGRLIIQVPRRGLGGSLYRLGYGLRHGIWPRLYSQSELHALAARCGLRPAGRRVPAPHCHFLAFQT